MSNLGEGVLDTMLSIAPLPFNNVFK